MRDQPTILAIVGPTASGKTPLGLLVGEHLEGEIISADSRQVYKFMDIGTAKPSEAERRRVRHHLIDFLDPADEYSAGRFMQDAREAIDSVARRGRLPMLVGGSGLYVRAAVDGLFEGPSKDPEIRNRLEERLKEYGVAALLEELRRVDPATGAAVDATKPRRIVRALEVYYVAGKPISELQKAAGARPPYRVLQYALQWDRESLYRMIEERVDRMMDAGFLDEVASLRARGYGLRHNSLNTVGYKELLEHLDGHIGLEEAKALIKRNTKHFAKRQLTWFRADTRIRWLKAKSPADLEPLAGRVAREFVRK